MIKLIRDNNKFRLVNTKEVFVTNKNEIIFISSDVKFSFCDDVEDIGNFDDDKEMVNLITDTDDDCDYIPIIDMEIVESVFEFIKKELENITKKYGNILEYEIIEDNKNMKSEELDTNIIIKDVLKVKFERIFDKWGMKIVYQDFDILKRGEFNDSDIKVSSKYEIEYYKNNNLLYILGKDTDEDSKIIFVNNKEKEIIENKVKLINEKYGIEEKWKAEEGDVYYFIYGSVLDIDYSYDNNNNTDNTRYKLGNYFKTKELAEEKVKEIKELLLK